MFDEEEQKNNSSQGGLENSQASPKKEPSGQQPNQPDAGQSKEGQNQVEDILAETDSPAKKPAAFQPKDKEGDQAPEAGSGIGAGKIKRLFTLILMFCLLALAGAMAYWGYSNFFISDEPAGEEIFQPETSDDNPSPSGQTGQTENGESQSNDADADDAGPADAESEEQSKEQSVDTDGDGLSDARERQLGTNINNVDTDSDGLFDLEEVNVYKTDPKNPDTDGDGYSDGDEVKSGFDPKGPGKLYEIGN